MSHCTDFQAPTVTAGQLDQVTTGDDDNDVVDSSDCQPV